MRARKALYALGILLAALVMAGCSERPSTFVNDSTVAAEAAQNIQFIREPRSGLCFAYLYVERGAGSQIATGGPALATVDCEKVKDLLVIHITLPREQE